MGKDYYNILGVSKTATKEEIKKAFRQKAHQYHPDKAGGDEAKFKEINEAYQVIGDEKKRAQYDQFGSNFEQAQAGGGFHGFEGFRDFSGFASGFSNEQGVNMEDLGDIFGGIGDMFGFGGGRGGSERRNNRGHDLQVSIKINFLEAVFGTEKEISINKKVKCDKCNGNGAEPGTKIETCQTCGGSGRVAKVQRTILGNIQVESVCPSCQGEGKTYSQKCSKCKGRGTINENVKFKIKIPAGIDNGETIRLNGYGEAGEKGAPSGDLYVKVMISPDKRFLRDGFNIYSEAEIGFTEAALGSKIDIETVEGVVKLKIPAGTQSGTTFKIRGKGVPKLRGGGKGDHFVKVKVKTPTGLNRKQKKLLEELNL